MKASVAAKLASLVSRARELDALLSDPEVTANLDNYRKLNRELAEIAALSGDPGYSGETRGSPLGGVARCVIHARTDA